jgi:hypothetical protein
MMMTDMAENAMYQLASSLVLMQDMKDQAAGLDAVVESCACAVTSPTESQ